MPSRSWSRSVVCIANATSPINVSLPFSPILPPVSSQAIAFLTDFSRSVRLLHILGFLHEVLVDDVGTSPDISLQIAHRGAESAKVVLRERLSSDLRSAPMTTECSTDLFGFASVEGREVVAGFDGGAITSDAGALLLGAADRAIGLIRGLCGVLSRRAAPGPDRARGDDAGRPTGIRHRARL